MGGSLRVRHRSADHAVRSASGQRSGRINACPRLIRRTPPRRTSSRSLCGPTAASRARAVSRSWRQQRASTPLAITDPACRGEQLLPHLAPCTSRSCYRRCEGQPVTPEAKVPDRHRAARLTSALVRVMEEPAYPLWAVGPYRRAGTRRERDAPRHSHRQCSADLLSPPTQQCSAAGRDPVYCAVTRRGYQDQLKSAWPYWSRSLRPFRR